MSELSPDKKPKSPLAVREEQILEFWKKERVFEQSVEKPAGRAHPAGDFVFYDGPPFATGSPHYGHLLAGTIKDAIPRYKTMQGYRVRRRWGWDCHGLPVENLIEKDLGLKTKKDILTYGIEQFNEAAREKVMSYAHEWRKVVPRFGRFVDMDNDYQTMDSSYTESVWWAFKTLYDNGLVNEGFKVMQICTHCETTLSNFEVAQGYKDITDLSAYAKFELVDEPGTFLVAWTTTPWTLPGNAALAINPDVEYVKVPLTLDGKSEKFIVAKARLDTLKKGLKADPKIEASTGAAPAPAPATLAAEETFLGKKLIGKKYKPVFDYYINDTTLKNRENGWKIYGAEFVTTEDGTGIVHIAPAFGTDDYALSLKEKIPFIQHVSFDGKFKKEVTDFVGQSVKPKTVAPEKDAHQKGDIEIIKYLAHHGTLFAKEKIIHSYPHCWRCETPLLNYATSSWFVKVSEFKDKLIAENKKVKWVPPEIGQNRFGDWLENARDWAISRSRFWGAPLPVWKDEVTGECEVVGSLDDLKKRSHTKNTYFVMRHGEAENNARLIASSLAAAPHHLTEKGKRQTNDAVAALKKMLADKKIDLIFVSPFVRTQETAKIVADALGISAVRVVIDERIHEINAGVYDGKPISEYHDFFQGEDRFTKAPKDGENFTQIKKRMGDFLYGTEARYSGKNILIITHDTPAWLLCAAAKGLNEEQANKLRGTTDFFIKNAEVHQLDFVPLPHNPKYELDFHRPYIDTVPLVSAKGNKLVRVPEVFDCWFESGSMPYGETHYPFDKAEFDPQSGPFAGFLKKSKGYPADFIAEGLDQTRGWFYSMLVLGVGLFGHSPYKHVIVNGLVLAEDGQKMSKSKSNYPDPMKVVDAYSADAIRYYLLSSPVVHGQDFRFTEKGVDEVVKKHIGRLNNVLAFYELYAGKDQKNNESGKSQKNEISKNILDRWIVSKLAELATDVTHAMDAYELDRATRPFAEFIDDLSTWYLRRSRDRFKTDEAGLSTLRFVLIETAKLLAPFMPFLAEDIYGRLKNEIDPVSVHLAEWPDVTKGNYKLDKKLLTHMKEVRRLASLGLEARSRAKINVRQPLAALYFKTDPKSSEKIIVEVPELIELIKDEVNVKQVAQKADIVSEVELDVAITPELKEEGNYRELVRAVQDLRKTSGLTVDDLATLSVATDELGKKFLERHKEELSRATGLKDVIFADASTVTEAGSQDVIIDGMKFALKVQ